MKRIVADLVAGAHGENGLPRRLQRRRDESRCARSAAASSGLPRSVRWPRCAVNSCRTASATGDSSCAKLASPACNARSRAARSFAADRIVVTQIERAQQRLQRQSLDHQRAEHDGERRQHDQVAIRKRRRQRQRRGERDDAAHAGPRDDQAAPDGRPQHRPRRMKADPAVPPPDDGVERHVPGEAHQDHRHAGPRRRRRSIAQRSAASRLSRIGRICRPMKMNARMFSANTTVSHTA